MCSTNMTHLKYKNTLGDLPTYEYDLFNKNQIIGHIQIRGKTSHGIDIPEKMASHIYYKILPEHRLNGYGKQILSLGLEEAWKLGLREIFITCMGDNTGSKKIIEANNGTLVDEAMIPSKGDKMLKYRILLSDSSTQEEIRKRPVLR